MSDINKSDCEDCDACNEAYEEGVPSSMCLYHEGMDAGQRMMADLLRKVIDDPESVAKHLAYAEAVTVRPSLRPVGKPAPPLKRGTAKVVTR